ncbi:MAG: TonB-dependent receptor [Alphaproteobacteria bacterium HGW-Alphaproteobacteria-17]|nr:MAG: TonB-dependent receptor [Alphaproteobacteria bacterium HGW-Alphaproteobacteria-17]
MKKTQFSKLKLGAAPLVMSVALVSAPAYAQSVASDDETATATGGEIVVTGTRISNPNVELSSPVAFISEDEIQFRQPVSAEDFLRELPGATPNLGPQTNNGSTGAARLDLRNLGSNRNLVLLNGRRVTPRDTNGVVDLNIIPLAMVERVDVLTGGAATVYGADAIAGVANFMTRRDFSGFDLRSSYGITERGDGSQFRADLTIGANFDDGRGNAVLSFGYTKTKPVLQGDRAIGTFARASTCTAAQLATCASIPVGVGQGSPTAAPASIGSPFVGGVNAAGDQFIVGPQNDYNFNPINLFQSPLERFNIFGQARYQISSAVEAYAEAMYVKSIVEVNLAPAGVFGSALQVPLNSPFLSAQQRGVLCNAAVGAPGGLPAGADCAAAIAAGTPVTVGVLRRFTEAGPRVQEWTTNFFHGTAGLRGPLTSTLKWDISGSYGESDQIQARRGWGLLSRVRSGVLGCPAGSAAGCVPINLFGPEGSITREMLNFIDLPTYAFANTSFANAQAVIDGDLGFSSPLAETPISFATGVEYRRYFASSGGDATSQIPGEVLGAGAAALPISGSYNSKEVFLEVAVPLVEEKPFFHNLTVDAGIRYADYSTSGGATTWKVGGTWAPIEDFKFRGVYTRAVRAPNIAELFQPQVTALTSRPTDPCQGTLAEITARGANFQALCLAQLALVGAPAGLLGTIPGPAAGQIQSTQGGNPNLDPEKARTITAGIVVTPSFLRNVTVSFDYFNIRVTDAITTPSQSDVIDGCFQANSNADLCTQIFRNPLTGSLSGPADTTFGPVLALSNLGTIKTNGFDLAVRASHSFDFGKLSFDYAATWTRDFLFQATPLSINRQCVGYYSTSCGTPQPKFKSTARLTFSTGGSDLSLLWRHINSVEVEPVAPAPQRPVGTPTTAGPANVVGGYRKIDAYDWFDLSFRQAIAENFVFTLTVNNLLDKDAPDVGNAISTPANNSGNTFPTLYDTLGRRYTVGVNLRF